jgi:hypothetical protein
MTQYVILTTHIKGDERTFHPEVFTSLEHAHLFFTSNGSLMGTPDHLLLMLNYKIDDPAIDLVFRKSVDFAIVIESVHIVSSIPSNRSVSEIGYIFTLLAYQFDLMPNMRRNQDIIDTYRDLMQRYPTFKWNMVDFYNTARLELAVALGLE